jgi:hypothetical protein
MLLLKGTHLLTSCKAKTIYAHDYCVIASPIYVSQPDKTALKKSTVSKQFIEQLVNHNDLWNSTCKNDEKIHSN